MVLVNRKTYSSEKSLRGCKLSDQGRNPTVLDKPHHPFSGNIKKSKSGKSPYDHILTTWAESFIFAGSSALLLLIANLFSVYWYFSFFALVPFLYRIIKATPIESLRLGILLGVSFFSVSVTDSLPISPIPTLLKLLLGTGLFAVFGWTVGWVRKQWGFYPSIVAVLWIGVELGVMQLGFPRGMFLKAEVSGYYFPGLVSLLGFLTVSAIIVLSNSLLVLVITKILKPTQLRTETQPEKPAWNCPLTLFLLAKRIRCVPEDRAPPKLAI
jgi:hypothetical protein